MQDNVVQNVVWHFGNHFVSALVFRLHMNTTLQKIRCILQTATRNILIYTMQRTYNNIEQHIPYAVAVDDIIQVNKSWSCVLIFEAEHSFVLIES